MYGWPWLVPCSWQSFFSCFCLSSSFSSVSPSGKLSYFILDVARRRLLFFHRRSPALGVIPLLLVLLDSFPVVLRPRHGAVGLRVEPQVLPPVVPPVELLGTELARHFHPQTMLPIVILLVKADT